MIDDFYKLNIFFHFIFSICDCNLQFAYKNFMSYINLNPYVITFFLLIVRMGKFIYKCVKLAIYECKLDGFVLSEGLQI